MVNGNDGNRLQQARQFDRAALAGIYDEYHPLIYRYIYRRVGDVQTAEDLTAVVFQRFLEAVKTGSGPERDLRAWLYRVAHNLVVDHYRRQQYRQHLPLKETLMITGNNPEQTAGKVLMVEQLREALGYLTPEQQQVISLKFLEGLSNAEAAAVMEKPVGAVKSLQHRGLAALHRLLSTSEREDEPTRMGFPV